MNVSVDYVLKSLLSLERRQQSKYLSINKTSNNNKINERNNESIDNSSDLKIKNYKMGLIMKIIVNIPLDVSRL
jgi:hypothetical protein